jgi:hypothetical protein
MADTAKISISSVTKEMVMQVEVTGVRWFSFRLTIAKGLIWLAAKIAGVGVQIVKAPDYGDLVKNECPIAYWKMDDTSGTTTEDTSGNNRNGTYNR